MTCFSHHLATTLLQMLPFCYIVIKGAHTFLNFLKFFVCPEPPLPPAALLDVESPTTSDRNSVSNTPAGGCSPPSWSASLLLSGVKMEGGKGEITRKRKVLVIKRSTEKSSDTLKPESYLFKYSLNFGNVHIILMCVRRL